MPETIAALDGSPSSAVPLPSLLVRLPKAAHLGQSLEKVVLASGLLASKSEHFYLQASSYCADTLFCFQHKRAKRSKRARSKSTMCACRPKATCA